eukprot:TRINITY_DN1424_c0_g1_i12.p1 TRINITY_DN1424_c0_g1~~TRINITY_DN1424_c0_g1_i12.p1  ORF type:complete len:411 (+),score=130.90 TRINITY_DN1424_c0_g1_i12:1246-2478(+)
MNRMQKTQYFTVYDYAWMLNPESKSLMLQIQNDIEQEQQAHRFGGQDILLNLLMHGSAMVSPYCDLEVRRDNLIEDTLNMLSRPNVNFKKELRVKFVGEQGEDSGGLRKEFFQLITKQLFDPSYSMFNYSEETRTYWFNPDTFEPCIKFELIGFVLGLALYNSTILDVHFPRVVYKKLLSHKPDFNDLVDFSPAIAQSLDFILKYEGEDLKEVLECTFSVEVDKYGKKVTAELIPGGSAVYVTQENKKLYVEKYVEWLFEKSVEKVFEAFKRGFCKLYKGEMATHCDPEELQLLICGSPVLDFRELEKAARYEGYTKDSPPVVHLWQTLHSLDVEKKKRFLFFSTGSDRAPIGGLKNISLCVMRHGEDGEQLPSSHTCFNYLMLPPYKSKAKLKEKLLLAIENSEGFGLI